MKKRAVIVSMLVATITGIVLTTSCTKESVNTFSGVETRSEKSENLPFTLIAEVTTDTTFDRFELLDLNNIYESVWNRRSFVKDKFLYDVVCTRGVFNASFSILKCGVDEVSILTDEGDTVQLFNITSSDNIIKYDVLRDDESVAHFSFTLGERIDFMSDMRTLSQANGAKGLPIIVIAAHLAGPVGVAVAVVGLGYQAYRVHCDRIIRNGAKDCHEKYGCSFREGRCCVVCKGGAANPHCDHDGDVIGNGSSCNSL